MEKSIYSQICDHITDGILSDSFSLPDEVAGASPLRFAPGAFDGMCMYHMRIDGLDADSTKEMAVALKAAAGGNFREADELFHEWAKEHRAIRFIDDLQKYIMDHASKLDPGRMHHSAVSLILHSPYIESVKIGLEILELFNEPDEKTKEIIRRVGLYDEFTIFAVWNMLKWTNGNAEIFALAKKTHSWGRIHAVERLEPKTEEIRRWLLTEGIVNDVMSAYSALPCWQKSLAEQILFRHPSPEEYKAIMTLIEGLMDEGPVPGISKLENAENILLRFLEIAEDYDLTADDYDVILTIQQWANDEDEPHPSVSKACGSVLQSPRCTEAVETAVNEGKGLRLAEALGIPYLDKLFCCMKQDFENYCYYCDHLMRNASYVQPTLDLFREKLPLSEIKGDPIADPGLGREYEAYNQLQYILQELDDKPLAGADLVKAGLESRISRNRYRALSVLQSWVQEKDTPLSELAPDLFEAVGLLQAREIDKDKTEMITRLLEGQTHFYDDDEDEFEESEE